MSKETKLEKEYWEVRKFLNICYRLEIYDEDFLENIDKNTLLYVYNELNLEKSIISSFIENGYEPSKETLLEWIDGYWSIQDCLYEIFKKSDKNIQNQILDIFKKSIKVHINFDRNSKPYTFSEIDYIEFSSLMKEEYEVQKIKI